MQAFESVNIEMINRNEIICISSSFRFDSSVAPLIFADQFIKISTRLASPLVYGFGEHEDPLLMNLTASWKRLTFWSRDVPPTPSTNLYGR